MWTLAAWMPECLDGRVTLCAMLSYRSLSPRDWNVLRKYLCHSVIRIKENKYSRILRCLQRGARKGYSRCSETEPPGLENETIRSWCKKKKQKKQEVTLG